MNEEDQADSHSHGGAGSGRGQPAFWTIPNVLCIARFSGSFGLLPIAAAGLAGWFVGVYLVLILSDLIDGPIARSLRQRSNIGAHLDSIADVALNSDSPRLVETVSDALMPLSSETTICRTVSPSIRNMNCRRQESRLGFHHGKAAGGSRFMEARATCT